MSKSYRTKSSQRVTLTLLSGGKGKSENVWSPFGPAKVGLITLPDRSTIRASQDQQLSVLLSTLERQAETLLLKSYEVLDTFLTDTTHLVEPTLSKESTTTTEEIKC
jgi:hypothetical protein